MKFIKGEVLYNSTYLSEREPIEQHNQRARWNATIEYTHAR